MRWLIEIPLLLGLLVLTNVCLFLLSDNLFSAIFIVVIVVLWWGFVRLHKHLRPLNCGRG